MGGVERDYRRILQSKLKHLFSGKCRTGKYVCLGKVAVFTGALRIWGNYRNNTLKIIKFTILILCYVIQ